MNRKRSIAQGKNARGWLNIALDIKAPPVVLDNHARGISDAETCHDAPGIMATDEWSLR
ncbi:MAG: hypothetical protein KDK53_17920 [Maritimibacter sp.]|nr:hypothetical protein [Maritimibacter sp.]